MTDNNTTLITKPLDNNKSKIRLLLETLESEIHISWLRDLEKINELLELNKILTEILNSKSIEDYFQYVDSDFDYFIRKFSKEAINNILRQHFIIGENGDEIGLEILGNYLKIFIKFMENQQYLPLWESVKDIIDYNKPFYKGTGYKAVLSKIENYRKLRKEIKADKYNELFLTRKDSSFIKIGEEIDILHENKKPYGTSNLSEQYWTRGKIKDIKEDYFFVNLAEEENSIKINKSSLNYSKEGTYTKDYDWKKSLIAGDVIECLDRGKFFPATIIERIEEERNGMTMVTYNIGFRLYPESFPQWENYKFFWDQINLMTDNNQKIYYGDKENFDEKIPFFSSRIQKLGTQEQKIRNLNKDDSNENETFHVDDLVVYDLKAFKNQDKNINLENKELNIEENIKDKQVKKIENTKNNIKEREESDSSKLNNYIAKTKQTLENYGKSYVIAKSQSFSLYYAILISEFASCDSYEKMLNLLHKDKTEKPNPELIYFIFLFFGYSSTILHKEFLKRLAFEMKDNVMNYLNDLTEKELRNIKKETIDIILKVLQYYLSFSMTNTQRISVIETFTISFSLKMLKSSLLDKRISAIKSIVDIIQNARDDKGKIANLLKLIEENNIFNEIFGPNSHIQLINRSKSLLEIMLSENKLSNEELELIWDATKKGDSEAKLTVMKLLEEISLNLKENHVKTLLEQIYLSEPECLIKEEVDLVYQLATHFTQTQDEIKKAIDFYLKGLFSGKIDDDEEKMQLLIDKIFVILKNQSFFVIENDLLTDYITNILIDNIKLNNMKNCFTSLRILKLLIKDFPQIYSKNTINIKNGNNKVLNNNDLDNNQHNPDSNDNSHIDKAEKKPVVDMNEFIKCFIVNFKEYRSLVKSAIKNKNNSKDNELFANIDNFTYSKNIRKRLGIISSLIFRNIWHYETDPIDLVYDFLMEDSISEKDNLIFYEWIKFLVNAEKLNFESETNIFNLFNKKICADSKKCQNLSIQGFESYLKIFLDVNKKNDLLDFYVIKNQEQLSLFTNPENLLGFEILWKIIFESFSAEIMNRGIQILHLLYNDEKSNNEENLSEVLLRKCIDLIKETNQREAADEGKENVIVKCLIILRLMIEESEKKGTAGIKSHSALIKNKVINITVSSYILRVNDFKLKLYANTTFWELKEIVSKKSSIALDLLKIKINQELINDNSNGKTITELNLSDGNEIEIFMNKLSEQIPKADLILEEGNINPRLLEILNEWFNEYSDNEEKMTREYCSKFIRDVTNSQENIPTNDYRINFLFETYNLNKESYIPREGFIMFYSESLKSTEKLDTVWDNLSNMGIRNDLRKIGEGLTSKALVSKHSLARYKLAHNEEFFETIFSLLNNSNKNLAKKAFEFLCIICTNEKIYESILNAKSKDEFDELIDKENVYKLVYILQIIESLLEDIEIEKEEVDIYALHEVNKENELDLIEKETNGEINYQNNFINKSTNLGFENDKFSKKKIEWIKNFVENEGFNLILKIFEEQLDELDNKPNIKDNCSVNKISNFLLLKIIKILYNCSLNKFQINKEVNQLIKNIKKSSTNQSSFGINDNSEDITQKDEIHILSKLKSMQSVGTFNNKDLEQLEDENNNNEFNVLNKLNSNSYFNLDKKNSIKLDSDIDSIEKIFDEELSGKIISAIQGSNFTEKILKLLSRFDMKLNMSSFDTIKKEEDNLINEDSEIFQNAFEILCSLISFYDSNVDEKIDAKKIIISDEANKKSFSELCLYSLINPIESIRENSSFSLIRLTKILSVANNFDILGIIFNEIFEFLITLEKSSKHIIKNNIADKSQQNNLLYSKDLRLNSLFEFFSFIIDIYFLNKKPFSNSLQNINSNINLLPEEFIMKIAKSLEDDLNSTNLQMELPNEIFIGYLKIISKVVENNNEIKLEISEKYNLIDAIMTKILFKQNEKIEFSQIRKDSIAENHFDNLNLEFINPESFSDLKSSRRKDQNFRKACYKLILSMIKNSVKNFEKFFAINILEDPAYSNNNINFNKKLSINSQSNNYNFNNNETDLNNNTTSNNNFSRQNSNNNNNNFSYNKYIISKARNYISSNASKAFGHVGLRNLGCICYMNSMLQQFFMVPSFRKAILQTDDKLPEDCNNHLQGDDNAFHQVQRMFAYLSLSNREEYNPEAFCFSFKDYEGNPTNTSIQQDAQEFLSRFLDKIEFSLKPTNFKYLIHSVFGGKICSQLKCESCNTTKKRFEDMFFLSLTVSKMKNIYESLNKFISEEKIDEYNCDTCAKKVTITKRNVLSDLPNVLIIHLQRIFYNYETDCNEKINSRLEFPKVLNLKDYTLEEIEKQNYLKTNNIKESELNSLYDNNEKNDEKEYKYSQQYPFENDDVYFKNDEYYEYHLVGVNVHIGSADAGHYFSYINKLRNGEESKMIYDPQVKDESDLWLKFNDTTISKFNIEKLEEECFGGKMDNSEENISAWNFQNSESIQSAYMLVYERRLKNPIKYLLPNPAESQLNSNSNEIISYKDEEEKAILKENNLLFYLGKPDFAEKSKKIFNSIFYDNAKNEYYKYIPFFSVENLVPLNYYKEIIEDNNRLEKMQNISDEQFADFFETVINLLDEAVHNNTNINDESQVNNILCVFLDFIYNVLSCPDKIKLLVTAKTKLIRIIEKSPSRLNAVVNYLNENHENIFKYILNDDINIVRIHCSIIYEIIANISNLDFDLDCIDVDNKNAEDHKAIKAELIEKAQKLVDFVLFLFPKIPARNISNIGPLLYKIRDLCNLSSEFMCYIASKEVVFILITFLLGRDSPHYIDTLNYEGENWDYCRNTYINPDPIIQLVYSIFKKYKEEENKAENQMNLKEISLANNTNSVNQNDNNSEEPKFDNFYIKKHIKNTCLLSQRDLNCLKNSVFLKQVLKSNKKLYTEIIAVLSKNDKEFSIEICSQITKFFDDLLTISENEIIEIIKCICPLLEIEDDYQLLRYGILVGYPQLIIEEATIDTKFANLGYHSMEDVYSRIIEVKNSISIKNSTCLMKKVFDSYSKETVFIEIFLVLIEAAVANFSLLKYLRAFTCEDYIGEDFISLGITKIKDYCKRYNDATYFNKLREVAHELNDLLPLTNSNENLLCGFKGFLGKFLNKSIKREVYTLIHTEENLSIFRVEYYTNIIDLKDVAEFDFSNSKAFKRQNNIEADSTEIHTNSDIESENLRENYPDEEFYLYDIEILEYNENEFLKKMLPLISVTGKKILVNSTEKIENFSCNVIRYFAINDSNSDAKVTLRYVKKQNEDHSNQINEFIPDGDLVVDVSGFSHKNLLVLAKIDPNLPWSFERSIEKNKSELILEHLISVEFDEQKISYYPSNEYRADYSDLLKHYQYQRLDLEQFNGEHNRSDDYQNWDEVEN